MNKCSTEYELRKAYGTPERYIVYISPIKALFLLLSFLAFFTSTGYCWQSSLAYYDANGKFVCTEDAEENRIPDFSHAGYRGGGVELPEIPVKKTISPILPGLPPIRQFT